MENEKFQNLMLEHFGKVLTKLDGMESRLTGVESELSGVKSEVTTIKSELSGVKSEVTTIKSELSEVKSELIGVKESQIRMETDFGKKLDVLYYDWRGTQQQFNEEIKTRIKSLETKVEALQMENMIKR
ncbi:hypothetical protein JCM15765_44630 [Paradesulfitobacterium aromaticivorans]